MVDFIELTNTNVKDGAPIMVRKSFVVAIRPVELNDRSTCFVYLASGDMFEVKHTYSELKEQFKFE